MPCPACGSEISKEHQFREMMIGTREEFAYLECSSCGCLRISSIPENLGSYYPTDYYSFALRPSRLVQLLYQLHVRAPKLMSSVRRCAPSFASVIKSGIRPAQRILDVGCGGGWLIGILRSQGFDCHGIDPFVATETEHIRRMSLDEVDGQWDLIMFHHSLEHMTDHVQVLKTAKRILKPGGTCLVRIPVINWAWEFYGPNWVQLDAPRHFITHSLKSFKLTAQSAGLNVSEILFDSNELQFYASELYRRDIPLLDPRAKEAFTPSELRKFRSKADTLNRQGLGDQAAFFLKN